MTTELLSDENQHFTTSLGDWASTGTSSLAQASGGHAGTAGKAVAAASGGSPVFATVNDTTPVAGIFPVYAGRPVTVTCWVERDSSSPSGTTLAASLTARTFTALGFGGTSHAFSQVDVPVGTGWTELGPVTFTPAAGQVWGAIEVQFYTLLTGVVGPLVSGDIVHLSDVDANTVDAGWTIGSIHI